MELKDIKKGISSLWNWLPKEVRKSIKVSIYITTSFFISELVKELSGMDFDSMISTFAVNILLVFLKELKERIVTARKGK